MRFRHSHQIHPRPRRSGSSSSTQAARCRAPPRDRRAGRSLPAPPSVSSRESRQLISSRSADSPIRLTGGRNRKKPASADRRDGGFTPRLQATAHGPTNLQPAIQNVTDSLPGKLPARLLIISDFDASISNENHLSAALLAKQIHLDLLAIGEGSALPALRQISSQTTGNTLISADPAHWAQSARDLLSAALPDRFETEPVSVVFTNNAFGLAPQNVATWNRVWLKPAATLLAQSTLAGATLPMSAEWNLGEGRVLAVAFAPSPSLVEALSQHLAATPRDPRISVSHQAGRELAVTVRAIDGSNFLNDLRPTLNLQDANDPARVTSHPIPQTAPGEYTLHLPAPRSTQFASVIVNNRTADRFAVAGRYAPEFEAIGNDRRAMETLANRTGGAVILPTQNTPIDIAWPTSTAPIRHAAGARRRCDDRYRSHLDAPNRRDVNREARVRSFSLRVSAALLTFSKPASPSGSIGVADNALRNRASGLGRYRDFLELGVINPRNAGFSIQLDLGDLEPFADLVDRHRRGGVHLLRVEPVLPEPCRQSPSRSTPRGPRPTRHFRIASNAVLKSAAERILPADTAGGLEIALAVLQSAVPSRFPRFPLLALDYSCSIVDLKRLPLVAATHVSKSSRPTE